jgi:glyoxylase-like metal-dependent hydrolase (beta-lactamase superfamily II)
MPTSRGFDALTVIALADGEGPFFEPREAAFPDATADQWAAADEQDPGSVRDGGWWLRFRCFALRNASGEVTLIDTGIGGLHSPSRSWAPVPGTLPEELAAARIAPADVTTVVLTHLHTDHIGWSIDAAGAVMFPNARYLLQATEVAAIEQAPRLAEWLLAPLRASGQLSPVDGDADLGGGVRIVATPGHTPGHQSVLLQRDDESLLITGDLLVHVLQLIDPGLRYGHEMDADGARASRVAMLQRLAGLPSVVLCTSHLGEPFWPLTGA